MTAETVTAPPMDKTRVMAAWAGTLVRSAHNSLGRMDRVLQRTETKIVAVRLAMAHRQYVQRGAGASD